MELALSVRGFVRRIALPLSLSLAAGLLLAARIPVVQAGDELPPLPPLPPASTAKKKAVTTPSTPPPARQAVPVQINSDVPPPPPPFIAAPRNIAPLAPPPRNPVVPKSANLSAHTNLSGNGLPNPNFSLPQPSTPAVTETVLAWDTVMKEVVLKPGESMANYRFSFTNTASTNITIRAVRTSCGCTVAKVPTMPWEIPAGTNGSFEVTMDVRGKFGTVGKSVMVESSAGWRTLTVRAVVPGMTAANMTQADRARNLQVAMADRQAVFRGECGTCHAQGAAGKTGQALFAATCSICHEAEHRASMVPDLHAIKKGKTAEFWTQIVTKGKADSLMPSFAQGEGGPLTQEQIASLVEYLAGPFQSQSPHPKTPATAALP